MVYCPECGGKISNVATTCVHCGFVANNSLIPISEQIEEVTIPRFICGDSSIEILNFIPDEANNAIFRMFGKWENIQKFFPSIAEVMFEMFNKETCLVAKMDKFVEQMIRNGTYRFMLDSNGNILPSIIDESGKLIKQVRLEEITKMSSGMVNAISQLNMQIQMAEIADHLKDIENAVNDIHIEIQADRLAKAESILEMIEQTRFICDSNLRNIKMLDIINRATESRCILSKNFEINVQLLTEGRKLKPKEMNQKAVDSFNDILVITKCIQAECEGYAVLGEYEAGREVLIQFRDFVLKNKLDNKDTIRTINGCLETKQPYYIDAVPEILNTIDTKIEKYNRLAVFQTVGIEA